MELMTEADFQAIPGLRWKQDEDRTIIGTPYGLNRKARFDHLYFHGPGKLGIYCERSTPRAFTEAIKAYRQALPDGAINLEFLGEQDGCLIFTPQSPDDLPRVFMIPPGRSGFPAPESTQEVSKVSQDV